MLRHFRYLAAAAGLIAVALMAPSAAAQGRGKTPGKPEARAKVDVEMTVSTAAEVLSRQGFEILKVEVKEDHQIIHYRAGNQGRGKGHGPPAKMVIRRVGDRVVLEETPEPIRLEIGIKLGIKL